MMLGLSVANTPRIPLANAAYEWRAHGQSGRGRGVTHCVIAQMTCESALPCQKGVHPRALEPAAPTLPSIKHLELGIARSLVSGDTVAMTGLTSAKVGVGYQYELRYSAHAIVLARRIVN